MERIRMLKSPLIWDKINFSFSRRLSGVEILKIEEGKKDLMSLFLFGIRKISARVLCVHWRHITPSNGSVDIATVWKNTTEKHDRRWEIESECRSFSFNEWNSFSERVAIPRRAGSARELSYSLATRRRRLFFLFAFFSPFKKSFLGGESKKCHQWLKIYDFVVKETNKNGKMFIMSWSKVVKFATSDEREMRTHLMRTFGFSSSGLCVPKL